MLKSTYIAPSTKATTGISTNGRWPLAAATPSVASATTRTTSETIISHFRFTRSTTTPAGSAKSTQGTSRANPTRPAFAGEFVSARRGGRRRCPRPPSRPWTGPGRPEAGRSLGCGGAGLHPPARSEEHTSELQSRPHLVCRLLLEKKKKKKK